MKNFRKVIVCAGTAVLGVSVLTGCTSSNTNGDNSNTNNTQTSSSTNKKEEPKKSYDTAGLTQKTIAGVKFYTSMADKWDDKTVEDAEGTILLDEASGNNITISASDFTNSSVGIGADWGSESISKIKESLELSGFKNIDITTTEVNGKKAFKVSYKISVVGTTTGVELYYIRLSNKKMAIVTYTMVKESSEYKKEMNNVINTIEEA